jgi:hypothetical protein
MKVSWDDEIPNIWKIKAMFQTTNQRHVGSKRANKSVTFRGDRRFPTSRRHEVLQIGLRRSRG